jgi:hypothetical protein
MGPSGSGRFRPPQLSSVSGSNPSSPRCTCGQSSGCGLARVRAAAGGRGCSVDVPAADIGSLRCRDNTAAVLAREPHASLPAVASELQVTTQCSFVKRRPVPPPPPPSKRIAATSTRTLTCHASDRRRPCPCRPRLLLLLLLCHCCCSAAAADDDDDAAGLAGCRGQAAVGHCEATQARLAVRVWWTRSGDTPGVAGRLACVGEATHPPTHPPTHPRATHALTEWLPGRAERRARAVSSAAASPAAPAPP